LDADEERSAKMERIVFCSFLAKDERAYEKFIPWVSTLPFGNGET
jgi:hypothetical protein